MVHKIDFVKTFIFLVLTLCMCFFVLFSKGNVETNLLKTLLSDNIENSRNIVQIANKSASVIKIVFESDSEKNLVKLKENFTKNIDREYFETDDTNLSNLFKLYLSAPSNFLSAKTKKLLKSGEYDEIYQKSLEKLYNPAGISLTDFEKDPFMLFDDFVLSQNGYFQSVSYQNGKYYDFMNLKIKTKDGLSPELSNRKIKKIIKLQHKLSDKNSKIYLAGNPVHSYYTSISSIWNINIICIFSVLLICFLTYFYFKNLKILIPVFAGISFGMLTGYCATRLIFSNFQIITMVFSTMLIGIGIDYSYHYFFTKYHGHNFNKNLTYSLLTTIIPFALLYLTGIELLRQISVFSVFGLCAIYWFVLYMYPNFEFAEPKKNIKINRKLIKILTSAVVILGFCGLFRLKFNDSLTAFYSPSGELLHSEKMYNKISGQNGLKTQFVTVYGKNLAQILSKEEKVTAKLDDKNIEYMSISKIFPSSEKQKENFELVKKLYDKKLNNYGEILTSAQISKLRSQAFKPVIFDLKNNKISAEFLPDKNTSLIIIFSDKNIKIGEKITDIGKDISKYLKTNRLALAKIFPAVLILIFGFLSVIYGFKQGTKLALPPLFGTVCAFGMSLLVFGELNLFSIIALFLVLGFTIDYSIFRANAQGQTEDAVFVSCITTAFSFLMLSITGFKLISSITFMLFTGIVSAYLCGYLIFNKDKN